MLLADSSHARLERFFRAYLRDEAARLPRIFIHAGSFSGWLTRVFRIAAITVGCHVFVTPKVVGRDEGGRLTVPGWLVAHEAAHVLQYRREGFVPFLFNYLREYFASLAEGKKLGAEARMEAYRQLSREREAREIEAAYLEWCAGVSVGEKVGATTLSL
ncbi:MAG TPA: DUF4157 domain-containing protein [Pyrinomonadaceae bacterium]|nr:DUF4157 domain-containing protein [Pyrinomonadaceae bacterium]